MDYSTRFKISLISKGMTKSHIAKKLGITSSYLSYVVSLMDNGTEHLLPKSEKSEEIQQLVKDYVYESNKKSIQNLAL